MLDPGVADSVAALLSYVIDGPIQGRTGGAMALDRAAAGKTGTTNESAAVWFCGFTPDLATAVWVGDPRGGFRYPMKDLTVNGTYYRQVFGGTLPGPIWKDAMTAALATTPPTPFTFASPWGLKPGRGLKSIPGGTVPGVQDPNVFTFENGAASPQPSASAEPTGPTGPTDEPPTPPEPAPTPAG